MKQLVPIVAILLCVSVVRGMAQQMPATPAPTRPKPTTLAPTPTSTTTTIPATRPITLQEAEATAIKNNPQITVGKLQALQAREFTRETRAALYPQVGLSVTAVGSDPGSRISAGFLNNPIVYPRVAAGAAVSQLITDFGRTQNLVANSVFQAKAQDQNAIATQQQIVLAADEAFYNTLETKARG